MANASPRASKADSYSRYPAALSPPAPRPGPRLRRGRFQARAPMARKLCLLAPHGSGALIRRPEHEKTSHHSPTASKVMTANGRGSSVTGDWRKAAQGRAAAASQTGCLTEPGSRSPAALLPPTEAAKRQARPRPWRASCACSPRRERGFDSQT
ncbi:hypothetical protein XarbCFBP8149_05455 [Xanthomonas arboricola]|nr:hypothetical protein XarbCFBP8149_05455 [Xanthomonas arboricola]